jgi:serine/threonine protein kinase
MPDSLPPITLPAAALNLGSAKRLFEDVLAAPTPTHPATRWEAPSIEDLAPLFPQYKFKRMLGRGGMGAVYAALDPKLNRDVAIKILPPELADQPGFLERFQREAQSLAKLDHPNIVLVHELGTTAGHHYFVMDYVVGRNLAELMKEHRTSKARGGDDLLTFMEMVDIGRQVCEALQGAHEQDILHRDIKPANILITPKGRVKVADFGLARSITPEEPGSGITKPNEVMGTADYMAPEVLRGTALDGRSDVYSVGILLYEMLVGEVPKGAFPVPSQRTRLHPKVDRIVLKAMHSDPSQRYQDAASLAAALGSLRPRHGDWHRWRFPTLLTALLGTIGVSTALALRPTPIPEMPSTTETNGAASSNPLPDDLFYQESFDYEVGNNALPGHGGYARKNPSQTATSNILQGSLDYTDSAGNQLLTAGNSVHVDSHEEKQQIDDICPLTIPTSAPDVLWLSLVAKQTAGSTTRFFNLCLRAQDNTFQPPDTNSSDDEILAVGMPSNADAQIWHIWDRSTVNKERKTATLAIPTTQQTFLLVKMELNINDAGQERFTLWGNPRLDQVPSETDGKPFTSFQSDVERWGQIIKLRLGAGLGPQDEATGFVIDEIRIGTSSASVMPIRK